MPNLRILLVDDSIVYKESLLLVLENEGYIVDTATSFDEAIKKIRELIFDLVLVDLRLTDNNDELDISGFGVAKESAEKQIPCIIITAFGSVETVREALISRGGKAIAVDYVSKQAGTKALLNAIKKICGVSLIHISDLHPQVLISGEIPFDQDKAYSQFLKDVRNQSGMGLFPTKAVLVSGDISFQCQKESFYWAREYLNGLANELEIPLGNIILAPGNHDIDRKKAVLTHNTLEAIKTGEAKWFSKFDEYLIFSYHFYNEPAFSIDKLYRIFTINTQVAIVVFNSCLIEGDIFHRCNTCFDKSDKEHYYGWIDRGQIQQAGKELDEIGWNGLRIGMFHHHIVPSDIYRSDEQCQGDHLRFYRHKDYRLDFTFSDFYFKILLYGHRHKGELYQSNRVGMNVPYNFGAGSFWKVGQNDQETASYLILQLSPLEGKSRVLMRRYYPATRERSGYWGPDNSIEPNGIIPLSDIVIP